jgi:hypothetical protein
MYVHKHLRYSCFNSMSLQGRLESLLNFQTMVSDLTGTALFLVITSCISYQQWWASYF